MLLSLLPTLWLFLLRRGACCCFRRGILAGFAFRLWNRAHSWLAALGCACSCLLGFVCLPSSALAFALLILSCPTLCSSCSWFFALCLGGLARFSPTFFANIGSLCAIVGWFILVQSLEQVPNKVWCFRCRVFACLPVLLLQQSRVRTCVLPNLGLIHCMRKDVHTKAVPCLVN